MGGRLPFGPPEGLEPPLSSGILSRMLFYFHLHNDVHTQDESGRDLPDAAAARAVAEDEARAMAAESVKVGHLDLSHNVEVADENGDTLFAVTFGDVVAIRGRQGSPEGQP